MSFQRGQSETTYICLAPTHTTEQRTHDDGTREMKMIEYQTLCWFCLVVLHGDHRMDNFSLSTCPTILPQTKFWIFMADCSALTFLDPLVGRQQKHASRLNTKGFPFFPFFLITTVKADKYYPITVICVLFWYSFYNFGELYIVYNGHEMLMCYLFLVTCRTIVWVIKILHRTGQ